MTIADYISELARELRARHAPRARLLNEVEDHLRDLAYQLVGEGVECVAAEARAVARFGAAAVVAARFAAAAATTSADRAIALTTFSFGVYTAVFVYFASAASPLLRDFPQGAASFFALQVAAVALVVALVRCLRWRTEVAAPATSLVASARALALGTAALLVAGAAETTFALTRPAGVIAWSEGRWLVIAFGASLLVLAGATVASVRAAVQARAVCSFPGGSAATTAPELADDIAALAIRWRLPLTIRRSMLTSLQHAWGLTLAVATTAFVVVTAAGVAGAAHESRLAGAATVGLLEAAAIVVGFACCGRALGLRRQATR